MKFLIKLVVALVAISNIAFALPTSRELVSLGMSPQVAKVLGSPQTSNITFQGNYGLYGSTSNGSDTANFTISPASAAQIGRGAYSILYGEDHSGGFAGVHVVSSGSSGYLNLNYGTQGIIFSRNDTGATVWTMEQSGGDLVSHATNGGDIILNKSGSNILLPVSASVTAAGTTISDATQLTNWWSSVMVTASGTGVKLYNVQVGAQACVQNHGANDLELYPNDGTSSLNNAGNGAAITLAAATDDIACCTRVSATLWACTVTAAPST